MDPSASSLRSRVRLLRERARVRPSDLAKQAGITRQALHSIETGVYVPNTLIALHLARALRCTVEDLFSLSEPEIQGRLIGPAILPTRVRLAQVRDHWLAFPTSGQGGLTEAADGMATSTLGSQAQIKLFGDLDLSRRTAVLAGCDPSFALLSTHVSRQHPDTRILLNSVSSMAALRALTQGEAHAAGIHLYDVASGLSNWPYVEKVLPQRDMHLFTLWTWEQGLQVAPGNPKAIGGVQDLLRPDVRLQNRERDAGSRVLLDAWLDQVEIDTTARKGIKGYTDEVNTPLLAAQRVASGEADVAPGPRSAAVALGLEFVSLQVERFDLVVPAEFVNHPGVQAILAVVQQASFRAELRALGGYDPAQAGELWKTTA